MIIKREVVTTEVIEIDLAPTKPVYAITEVSAGDNIVYTKGRGNDGEEGVALSRALIPRIHAKTGAVSWELTDGSAVNFGRIRGILPDADEE